MMSYGLLKRKRLLSDRQEELLDSLREVLVSLDSTLERLGMDVIPVDRQALRGAIAHLDELFLLVIVGEFNAGKSSFVNAMLGVSIQPEGVTPTTDKITLLMHGDEAYDETRDAFMIERHYPADILRHLTIVDTPGTNAVIRRHEELTQTFVPRSDLVLFITSADRPFTESERVFLSLIKDWGKKVVLILNKTDILEGQEQVDQILDFIRMNARDALGVTPDVFAVSSRRAIKARASDEGAALWQESKFNEVESYIIDTLDEETRVRLKLLSPLGVAERLVKVYRSEVEKRLGILRDDFNALDNIDQQLELFRTDIQTDVHYHLNEIEGILRDMQDRGNMFFDEMMRVGRVRELMNSSEVQRRFEREVVGDLEPQIDSRIQALIDWTVEKNLRLWQNVMDFSKQRIELHRDGAIGRVGGSFDYNRTALLESIGQQAHMIVRSYDREKEAQHINDEVRQSLGSMVVAGGLGVGVGAILVTLFTSAALDITGILFATAMAAGGLFVLPAKRRKVKRELHERVTQMREQVRESVQSQFSKETEQVITRIREEISPYTRFVRAKREQLMGLEQELADAEATLQKLRADIEL